MPDNVFVRILLAFGVIFGAFAAVVATQSYVEHRSATEVLAGYGLPIVESPQEHFHKDRVALLLLGIDYNYDSKDQESSTDARAAASSPRYVDR